jgi:nucleoside-diphosphate-sugar epimerase
MREGKILVTGGTGFLGCHILADFLVRGYPVIALARSSGQLSGWERVRRLLDWLSLDGDVRSRLEVIEGSIDQPNLGMNSKEYTSLLDCVSEIVHCASDTSFSDRKKAGVERTNINGMEKVLDFAVNGRCFFFHYVSTAYVADRKAGICREELVESKVFTNVYEETKCRAEWMASERCGREGIRLSIYRPSIVYGNSNTGRSNRFNAVYYPIRALLFLKNLYEADIREGGGKRAREMGVKLTENGSLYLPTRVGVVANGGINLIPINYFVEAFTVLMNECLDGGIFHIVNQRLKRIEDLIDYTKMLFKIDGLVPCLTAAFDEKPKNALEILFDKYLEFYFPYMRDTRIFDNRKAQAILSKEGVVCPDLDFDVFSRCMNFAVKCEWGNGGEVHYDNGETKRIHLYGRKSNPAPKDSYRI